MNKEITTATITKQENDFLKRISMNEYCELDCLGYWVGSIDFDMKVTRGIMSSLSKKGIIDIHIGDEDHNGNVWVQVSNDWLNYIKAKFDIA